MAGINKAILIGNLGTDPEVRYLEGGVALARFPLATSESYKNKQGEKIENTEWHNITLWRGLAEVAEKYLRKGSQVMIEGKIQYRKYTDKDGIERYGTSIRGDNMIMLGGGGNHNSNERANNQKSTKQAPTERTKQEEALFDQMADDPGDSDDLPF